MTLFLAATIAQADSGQSAPSSGARAQATATIRIVQAEKLEFAVIEQDRPERLRTVSVSRGDDREEVLRIVEFE